METRSLSRWIKLELLLRRILSPKKYKGNLKTKDNFSVTQLLFQNHQWKRQPNWRTYSRKKILKSKSTLSLNRKFKRDLTISLIKRLMKKSRNKSQFSRKIKTNLFSRKFRECWPLNKKRWILTAIENTHRDQRR